MIAECVTSETTASVEREESSTRSCAAPDSAWQRRFLALLPCIRRHAKLRFRNLSSELREELVQETIVRALLDYARLVERGKEQLAYATPLARYAVAQVRQGRRVGSRMNGRDVSSEYCRGRQGLSLVSLDQSDQTSGSWQEIVVEDRRCGPDEIAATRIDFSDWLASLPKRNRHVAEKLARSESTSCVAHFFGITPGRVAQLRREFLNSWHAFHGETVPPAL
jgi:DNA-directed RNA polymerase specialized sigma24 family protein